MALFGRDSIVQWADAGEWIPLKCGLCGAIYVTKNLKYVGYRGIHYGHSPEDTEKYEKAKACTRARHPISYLRPDLNTYRGGVW